MRRFLVIALIACWSTVVNAAVTFDWVTVGNPGNANDTTGLGRVDSVYRISKYEVTNDQFAAYLNAVGRTDYQKFWSHDWESFSDISINVSGGQATYAVKPGFGSKPMKYVSFVDAMRFVNWLSNGQGASGTEDGVYTVSDGSKAQRAANAAYFIPSENEWYKAAYHDPSAVGGYWRYPTRSNTKPTAEAPSVGTNSGNLSGILGDTADVGGYPNSKSYYGTLDQAGNVYEWNEAVYFDTARGLRGAGFGNDLAASDEFGYSYLFDQLPSTGLRVASVPEPTSLFAEVVLLTLVGALSPNTRRRWPSSNREPATTA